MLIAYICLENEVIKYDKCIKIYFHSNPDILKRLYFSLQSLNKIL